MEFSGGKLKQKGFFHSVDLYAPCRHLIELTVGVPLLARGGRGLYMQKLLKYRTLVAVSAIWAQLPRRQVA
jgi:hypothetical protein